MNIRSLTLCLVPLCAMPALAGCGGGQSKLSDITMSNSTAVQMASGISDGKPPRLKPGAPMGIWVWQGNKGIWHVRTTTKSEHHRFQGRLHPLQGASLSALKSTSNDNMDRMKIISGDIVFDFSTQGDSDGFDFLLNGNACVEMDLRVDKKSHPQLIVVGKGEQSPQGSHFIACP